MVDFETVTPDLWMANEETWKEKLLKLPNLFQVRNRMQEFISKQFCFHSLFDLNLTLLFCF